MAALRRRDRLLLVRPSFELPPILNLAQLQTNLPVGASSSFLCFLGNGQKRWGETKLTKVGLLRLIPRRWKGWSSGWLFGAASQVGCCAPLPCWRGQPGAGDGGRDETYCSYLEHAHNGGLSHPRNPTKAAAAKLEQDTPEISVRDRLCCCLGFSVSSRV